MLNFINILTVAYNSWCFESVYTLYYIYKAEGMAEGTDCVCCGKESFWKAKGVHLEGKRSPFGKLLFLHPKTTGILWGWEE